MRKKSYCFFVFLFAIIMFTAIPTKAATFKKYKASKVTAKQITTELKKVKRIGSIRKSSGTDSLLGKVNSYKSKYSFYDKKYKKTYCTIEVFADAHDAVSRKSTLNTIYVIGLLYDEEETWPWESFRYKNVLFCYPSTMPYDYAVKYYYNYIKKIVK